jgi:hypothetical protein
MFSESMVNTPVLAEALESACEIAVTINWAGSVLLAVASVGTVFGATYMPLADIEPQTEAGVVLQLSSQVTAVFEVPVTVALNCTVWKVSIFETSVLMETTIGVLEPPPLPQAVNPKAPAAASMPAKHAPFFIGLSLRTRCTNDDQGLPLSVFTDRAATRRDRTSESSQHAAYEPESRAFDAKIN